MASFMHGTDKPVVA